MELIVITDPEMLPGEADVMNGLFALGLARLHVRKPEASEAAIKALIEEITQEFRDRIVLHQHHQLAEVFGISGLHFTEKNRLLQTADNLAGLKQQGFRLSTSLHDPDDLQGLSGSFDYVFLGPVFDSISKAGYQSILPDTFHLNKYDFTGKVFGLGGIDLNNIQTTVQMGFDGAAILGSIWQNPKNALDQYKLFSARIALLNLKCEAKNSDAAYDNADGYFSIYAGPGLQSGTVEKLHFISQEKNGMSHMESIQFALEAGCRWIQLRVKDRAEEDVLPIAWKAIRLCDRFGARLIINDFPRVAQAVQAYGLHLGLSDMPVAEARALVGEKMIIGGTANTWEDIALRIAEGADYIGLGPFRFTNTKQNLSPILGTGGYARLMQRMSQHGYQTPIIAIGGITPEDVGVLSETGIYGVAMSSALIGAANPKATVSQIQQTLC
jgi:thiamine-phosphate diphosphorylase